MQDNDNLQLNYANFMDRLFAGMLDCILLLFLVMPFLNIIFSPPMEIQKLALDYQSGLINQDQFSALLLDEAKKPEVLRKLFYDSIWQFLLVGIICVAFWYKKAATPGKMLLSMKIVDEETGELPTNVQLIIRYLAYMVSTIPLFMGFFWILLDDKKQTWHDKIAGTVVTIRKKKK